MAQGMAVKVLAALIALQVGVGGVALATLEDTSDTVAAGSATTTTLAGTPAGPEGAPPVAGEPGAPPAPAPGGPEAASAPGPGASAVALNSLPERPAPPKPGTYRYKTKGNGQASFGTFTTQFDEEGESDVRFAAVGGAPAGEARDREHMEGSKSSGTFSFSGNADKDRSWRPDGMFVTAEAFSGSGEGEGGGGNFSGNCDWQPDVVALRFPLKVGTTWEWDSSCESRSEDFDMTRHYRGTAKVTGTRTASVGGKEVNVFVIERQSTQDVQGTFRYQGREGSSSQHHEEKSTILFAPSVSLEVRTDSEIKGTMKSPQTPGQEGRFEGSGYTELLSLDPK